jgi:E3 ubiquitin-protein ligase UBR7
MTVDNEKETYSLQDVIEHENQIKDIANAVLGASDHTNCSYDQGYVYRQALYSCLTCLNENKTNTEDVKLSGICLACSYECHQNHQLVELYTKRDFRCDCGNENFNQTGKPFACKLQPNKDKRNSLNAYNHNFLGLYCSCNMPYPDDGSAMATDNDNKEEADEMLQCTVCEDWHHFDHLLGVDKFEIGESMDDLELVCQLCMANNQFLWLYQKNMPIKREASGDSLIEVTESKVCLLGELESGLIFTDKQSVVDKKQACFFSPGWRKSLCQCAGCLSLYKENKVEFLLRNNDTIEFYESLGKEKAEEESCNENKLLNEQLGKLDRVAQINFLSDFNDFKEELSEFLAGLAKLGEVVTSKHIADFFEKLNGRKRQRSSNSFSYSSCK